MRQSEFQLACAEEFGAAYAGVLIRDHWIARFAGTAADAIERGEPIRDVWLALCEELDVPLARRHGRGLMTSKKSA